MINKKVIEELEKIRMRLTQIYHKELGNPKEFCADMRLRDEIEVMRKTDRK